MAAHPRLDPAFRPVLRPGGAVQLGTTAESGAILVSGLSPGERALLDRLDGSLSEAELYATAQASGVAPHRTDELLALLRHHGVLLPDHPDRSDGDGRRAEPRGPTPVGDRPFVVVDGPGALASSIATLLRASGVQRVQAGVWAADAADAELRLTGAGTPDLVVLVADGAVDPRAGEPWRRRAVPHLPVVSEGARVVVGPWVTGDPMQPCLHCLRLARSDHDAEWPVVEAQGRAVPAVAGRCDDPLVAMGAGMAVLVAQAGLAGGAVPAGVSVEVRTPWPRVDHRRWDRHTDCPHHDHSRTGVVDQAVRATR